jgi:predicted nucleic acid-binding protein
LILLDTSGLYAALNDREPAHEATAKALDGEAPPFLLSPFVLAEIDYLLSQHAPRAVELSLLREVGSHAYELAPFAAADVATAADVVEGYRDHDIGIADASIVVLAGRHDTDRVLTLDEGHFRALRTPAGGRFTILPADA